MVVISGKNPAAAFSDYCIIWVFREIFTEIPWRRTTGQPLVRVPQRKGTKSETKSMTTDKEKTHGRLDKNLKDRDLKLTQPITSKTENRKYII